MNNPTENRRVVHRWSARRRRIAWILAGIGCLGAAVALAVNAARDNLVFFYSPSQIAAHQAPRGRTFRIGGLVEKGSLHHGREALDIQFMVTDTAHSIPVTYHGVLPDMFAQGKGVVAQGTLGADGVFHADQVLAKHDANYMPPNVASELRAARAARSPAIAAGGGR